MTELTLGKLITYSHHSHPLVGIAADKGTWQCDVCKKDQGTVRGHCAACDWDLCETCFKKEANPSLASLSVSAASVSSLHVHPLEHSVSKAGWFVNYQCDVCKNSIGSGSDKYSCTACSFDVCGGCFERGGPPPTPAQKSSGWLWSSSSVAPSANAPSAPSIAATTTAIAVPAAPAVSISNSYWTFQRGMDSKTEMKLKFSGSTSSADIEKAIRARFVIPETDRILVIDPSDGCDVVLSPGLDRTIKYRIFTTSVKGVSAIPLPK